MSDPIASDAEKTSIPFIIALCVIAAGTVLSLIAYRILMNNDSRLVNAQLDAAAEHRVRVLEKAFRQASFAPFRRGPRFQLGRPETRARFASMAQRHLDISDCTRFLAWAPSVTPETREQFDEIAREQGFEDFTIIKLENEMDLQIQDTSLPIMFVADEIDNEAQRGVDLTSIPECALAIRRALQNGTATSTRPFRWPVGRTESATIAIVWPIVPQQYSDEGLQERWERMTGVGISVVDADAMIAGAFETFPRDVNLRLYRTGRGDESELVGYYDAPTQTIQFNDLERYSQMDEEVVSPSRLPVGGGWSIQCVATPAFLKARGSRKFPVVALCMGVLLSVVVGGYTRVILDRKDRVEQLSAVKTKELREANRFLDSVVDNIPTMLFIKDASDLRFVLFNKAGEELVGRSRDELVGKNDFDFYPAEEAKSFQQKDRDVLATKEMLDIEEEELMTKKGLRVLHTKKIPIYNESGDPTHLVGISEDVTERIAAVEELRRAKEAAEVANEAKSESWPT